jgi:hypothetical protein
VKKFEIGNSSETVILLKPIWKLVRYLSKFSNHIICTSLEAVRLIAETVRVTVDAMRLLGESL